MSMKTLLGTEIPSAIRGIVYLCNYDWNNKKLNVVKELLFQQPIDALNTYSNIPNPESQIAYGKTHSDFLKELKVLHKNMVDPKYLEMLEDSI